jgi:uncharacterized protein (TIGR00725 family)
MTPRNPIIAVVGGNDSDPSLVKAAERVGVAIAEAGAVLLTGSQPMPGEDIKRASMRGALEASKKKGVVARRVGILPAREEPQSTDVAQCLVRTGLKGIQRNPITGMTCDAMIVFEGGAGTLAELGFALAARKPILFAGSIDGLRRKAKDKRADLLGYLDQGTGRFPEILGRPVKSSQIVELIDERLKTSSDSAEISDDDSWAGPLVQKAIKMVDPGKLRQKSGFPSEGVLRPSKEEFEEWLRGTQ